MRSRPRQAPRAACRPATWPSRARPSWCAPATRPRASARREIAQAIVGYGDTRQKVLIANSLGDLVLRRPHAHALHGAGRGPPRRRHPDRATRRVGGSAGFELLDEAIGARRGARPRPSKARHHARLAGRRRSAPCRSCWPTASAARSSTRPAATGSRPTPSPRAPASTPARWARSWRRRIVSAYDDGSHRQRLGLAGLRRRGRADAEDAGHRGGAPHRLPLRPAARPRGGRRAHGQRPPPVVPPRAHPAHDDHVHRRRATPRADEIIAATPRGFYAKSLAGGQVEPASGNFVFGVAEGYLIENGRLTTPLRGATLVGNGIDILMQIDMIAGDFDVKTGICGKDGQGVPVGTGQATLRIARDDGGRDGLMFDVVDAVLERAAARRARATSRSTPSAPRRAASRSTSRRSSSSPRRSAAASGVRVFVGGAVGYAYTSDLSDGALDEVVQRAVDNAAVSDPDEFAALPRAGRRAGRRASVRRAPHARRPTSSASSWRSRSRPRRSPPTRASRPSRTRCTPTATARCSSPARAGVRGTLPRQPVLRLRLRAGRAGRPGRDRATRTPSAGRSRTWTRPPAGARPPSAPAGCSAPASARR